MRYLVMIDEIDLAPKLFVRVLIPNAVNLELSRPSTPARVRAWLATPPNWLERRPDPPSGGTFPPLLGAGERAAIALAQREGALLLIDDRAGVAEARARGVKASGLLGFLLEAARRDMVDLRAAFARLRDTNFRYRPELLDALLAKHEAARRGDS